jgi:hypothetical protein
MTRPRTTQPVALDYEIAQEQASALGRAGRALETALAALMEHDRTAQYGGHARAKLVQDASDALWRLVIQRECCGLRDSRLLMRDYRVPREVQNRMGVSRR